MQEEEMAESKRQQTDAQRAANLSVKIRALKKSSTERYVSKADFIRLILRKTKVAPAQIRDLLGKHGIEVTTKNVRDVKQRLPQYEAGKLKPRKKPQKRPKSDWSVLKSTCTE